MVPPPNGNQQLSDLVGVVDDTGETQAESVN